MAPKVTSDLFRAALSARLSASERLGTDHLEISAGELHREVGGYPGIDHKLPSCCRVMRAMMRPADEIVRSSPKGYGATLTIRYHLPRDT